MQLRALPSIIVSLLAVGLIAMIGWGLNKGFDFSDMGYHMLSLEHPEESPLMPQYQWFYGQWFGWMNLGVIGVRTLRLLLTIIASFVLARGLLSFFRTNSTLGKSPIFQEYGTYAMIFVGGFMSFALQATTLSYNNLTLIFLALLTGVLLQAVARYGETADNRYLYLRFLCLGMLLVLLFFAKFPSGISYLMLMAVMIPFLLLNRGTSFSTTAICTACFFGGIALMVVYYSITVKPITQWYTDAKAIAGSIGNHNPNRLLKSYVRTTFKAVNLGILQYFYLPLGLFFGLLLHRFTLTNEKHSIANIILYATLTIVIGIFAFVVYQESWYMNGMRHNGKGFNVFFLWLSLLLAALLAYLNIDRLKSLFTNWEHRENFMLCCMFLIIPVGGAAGTNNSLPLQSTQYLIFWFACFLIMATIISLVSKKKVLGLALTLPILFVASSQIYYGYCRLTQRVGGPLHTQNKTIEGVERGENLLVVNRVKRLAEETHQIITHNTTFEEGDPILAICKLPGLIYMMGGVSPGGGWYKTGKVERNCLQLKSSQNIDNLEDLIFIKRKNNEVPPEFIACMQEKGIDYPDAFYSIGTTYDGQGQTKVEILAPKQILKPGVAEKAKPASKKPTPKKKKKKRKAKNQKGKANTNKGAAKSPTTTSAEEK